MAFRMEDQFVHDRWGKLGYEKLLPEEQDYIMIWWLVAEVNNGTFAQYFSNETGDHALQALNGLKQCNAVEGARILQAAMDLFLPFGGYTPDQELRNSRIDKLEAHHKSPEGVFREISDALQDQNGILTLALVRVRNAYEQHGIKEK
jgi:hypothetical protein